MMLSNTVPAGPTNGTPNMSSNSPGASPIKRSRIRPIPPRLLRAILVRVL
jgi:hypothetical protein